MKLIFAFLAAVLANEAQLLEFSNLGFDGYYFQVSALEDLYSDKCSCKLDSGRTYFSGPNAPVNEEVSVHFRGPLVLDKFAVYTAPDFTTGTNSDGSWSRTAYYDADTETSQNVTFLTKAGKNSTCLGKALTYAGSDGLSEAKEATVLAKDTLIRSEEEYAIFSNVSCGKSGLGNDCGVYRDGIPAYHGYSGDIKMFLFEFHMPEEDSVEQGSVYNWNMPAIWLLNARIPRTAQYSNNANCSCWRSGCGEFDIFEVKNHTDTEVGRLYSTIHDYQGTDDIETGLIIDGYIERDYEGAMKGGVVFDADGNAQVFVSNSTTFDDSIAYSDLNSWISSIRETAQAALSSVAPVSNTGDGTKSQSSSKGAGHVMSPMSSLFVSLFTWLLI